MRFWLIVFVVLLFILDVVWMLDGFLNVHYSNVMDQESYLNRSTNFAYRLFAENPIKNLYYRIIISLMVFITIILLILFIRRLSSYRNMLDLSNMKYRNLFMELNSGFALRKVYRDSEGKIQDIRFQEVNPAFRRILNLGEADITGKSMNDVLKNINPELVEEYDRISRYGGSFTKIIKVAQKNKIYRVTAFQHSEDVFATLIEDISKEKQYESELVESNQLKSILLNTINEGVYYIDTEMNIIWYNKQAENLFNKKEREILAKKCYDSFYKKDSECDNCPVVETLKSKQRTMREFKDDQDRYLQIYSNPVFDADSGLKGIVLTIYDLTEWKSALENLKKKQEHLNMALEVGMMTAWEWDSESGKVSLEQPEILSKHTDKQWGLSELSRFIHPQERQEFIKQKDAVIDGELKEIKIEARIRIKPHEWVWFNLLGRIKEYDENGRPIKVIGITYNIDRLKKIALELKKTNDELTELKEKLEKDVENRVTEIREKDLLMIRQSRQAAMGEMIGNIAHQWRQPLNSIAVIIQDLVDAWDFGEISREYLIDKIDLSMSVINHMSQTIDDFRDFFSPDNQPQKFDLDKQIMKTINILKDMYASQGIEIKSQLENCVIMSYSREFSQVLINVFNNSKDALQSNNIRQPMIKVDLYKESDKAVIKILDNAGGIDPAIIDNIFDPYFTTKQKTHGTGVGLYMSKTIIEKHMKGEIYAENSDEGALFTITLPLKN